MLRDAAGVQFDIGRIEKKGGGRDGNQFVDSGVRPLDVVMAGTQIGRHCRQ